ncbi:Glycoprotein GP40 [Cryptosporidium meleagridis]
MWFQHGTPVATLKCGDYTIVYAPQSGSTDPAPRYISGDVTSVTFEESDSTVKIKVNNKELSTLSTSSSTPTENDTASEESLSRSRSRRSLTDAETTGTVDVLAFTLQGGKRIEVAIPNASEAAQRNKYSLVADNKPFYTGANSGNDNGVYRLDTDGNLVDKDNTVLLKDAAGSAFGFKYILPSVFAILAALFMM